ncbi:MAG: short-chain dehydrogenase/reductase [Dehalococcoidales bacterium]|nr:short-chain dehydrogenase/reductase [Dehalococcoidales bacterium]
MSVFDLTDKVAIVTGGGTGIGKTIALQFAKAGADVVVASRKQANLDAMAAEIRGLGRRSLAVAADVRVPEQVESLVKQTIDEFGKIDIIVNNAGAGFVCPAEEMTPNGWDAIININLKGVFLCSQAVGKVMISQKSGKIISIASAAGVNGAVGRAHYAAAKAGVINLTRTLAMEWSKHNINVNAIAPGMIETEGVRAQKILTTENVETMPHLDRPGQPEDVAYVAIFLASEASRHISGETIMVRGIQR